MNMDNMITDKVTDQDFGYPDPASAGMVKRVPAPSSASNRGECSVENQADTQLNTTGSKKETNKEVKIEHKKTKKSTKDGAQYMETIQGSPTTEKDGTIRSDTNLNDDLYIIDTESPFQRSSLTRRSPIKGINTKKPIDSIKQKEIERSEEEKEQTQTPKETEINTQKNKITSASSNNSLVSMTSDERNKRKRNADKKNAKSTNKNLTSDETTEDSELSEYGAAREKRKIPRRTTPPNRKQIKLDKQSKEEVQGLNREELQVFIQENAKVIENVVAKSSNLKGGCVKELKEATSRIRFASFALYNSANTENSEFNINNNEELQELKRRLKQVEDDNKKLKKEIEYLNKQVANKDKELEENKKEREKSNKNVGNTAGVNDIQLNEIFIQKWTDRIMDEIKTRIPKMIDETLEKNKGSSPSVEIERRNLVRTEGKEINKNMEWSPDRQELIERRHRKKTFAQVTRERGSGEEEGSEEYNITQGNGNMQGNGNNNDRDNEEQWITIRRRREMDQTYMGSTENRQSNRKKSLQINQNLGNKETRDFRENNKRNKKTTKYNKSAVISITLRNPNITYEQIMIHAKNKINLTDIGITDIRTKRALGGNLVMQIMGNESTEKAEELATQLNSIFAEYNDDIIIRRPIKSKEILLRDLEDGVTPEEIKNKLVEIENTNINNITIGKINRSRNRLATAWVKCPATLADKLVENKKIRIGWNLVTALPIKPRPLQCFKCWNFGHASDRCNSEEDLRNRCYVCSNYGHNPMSCPRENIFCLLCQKAGHESNHRMGNNTCNIYQEALKQEERNKNRTNSGKNRNNNK